MKLRTWMLIPGVVVLSVVTLTGAMCVPSPARIQAEQPRDAAEAKSVATLEGTWRVQVTQRNCQTGEQLRPTAPAMLTFVKDGTVTGTTSLFPPAMHGPAQGVWRHTGGQNYSAVTEAFLFNPSAPPTSAWVGTQRITQTIQLNNDELNATASVTFSGPDGKPVQGFPAAPICATAVARRME